MPSKMPGLTETWEVETVTAALPQKAAVFIKKQHKNSGNAP